MRRVRRGPAATLLPAVLALGACAATAPALPPPETVAQVDLRRYAGTWHEIARIPNGFQDGGGRHCVAVTATYTPNPDGTVGVLNRCRDAAQGGREVAAEGWARPAEPGNAKLRVTFFWPFFGDYWVIGLDPEYRWAVVGDPERERLWILSRTPAMRAGDYSAALAIARREGFDTRRLQPTPQPDATGVGAPPRDRGPDSAEPDAIPGAGLDLAGAASGTGRRR